MSKGADPSAVAGLSGEAPGARLHRPALALDRRRVLELGARSLPVLVTVALVLPSLVFVLIDRSIWNWDDSWYGQVAIDLWGTLRHSSLSQWHLAMIDAFRIKPPAISWIGQFFVPLQGVVGSVGVALKLSVVLAEAATILLLYLTGRRIGAGTAAVLAGVLLVAASPLFVDLSHYYLVEQFQAFSVAWMLAIMVRARGWHPGLTVTQIVAAASFGLLVKISSPVYTVAPAAAALALSLWSWRRREWGRWWLELRFLASAALAVVLAYGTYQWYHANWSQAISNTRFSTHSSLLGTRRSFPTELWFWLGRLGHTLFLPRFEVVFGAVLAAGVLFVVITRRPQWRSVDPHRAVYFVATVATAGAVVVGLALQVNHQDRFLLPAFPCLAVALILVVDALGRRLLPVLCVGVLAAEFGLVTDWAYTPPTGVYYYFYGGLPIGPPAAKSAFARQLDRIVRLTCSDATADKINVVGVDYRWLNHNNLELLAHATGESGRSCHYANLGLAISDPNAGWRTVQVYQPPYYIGVDYGNASNPLPADLVRTTNLDDGYNRVNQAVYRRVLASGRFSVVPGSRREGLVVLRAR